MARRETLLFLACFTAIAALAQGDCVYTVFVKTGWLPKAGTDSAISLEFVDKRSNSFKINNITQWGGRLLGAGHHYFERSNLDVFGGLGKCFDNPICAVNITSDGSGDHHGWYLDYVEVTTTGAGQKCASSHFEVEQWLATDAYPYSLTTYRDSCSTPTKSVQSDDIEVA